jgi:hypothetical protein
VSHADITEQPIENMNEYLIEHMSAHLPELGHSVAKKCAKKRLMA